MSRLLTKIRRSLDRDRDLPLSTRLAKGGRYVAASALAQLYLRDCDRVGARARAFGRPHVRNEGRIYIGADFTLNSTFSPAELVTAPGGEIEIGSGVGINYGTSISARSTVTIGDGVSIGPYCILSDSEHAATDAGADVAAPIEIGAGVWLAARVTVLPGTRIGAGSVVTAGSVVSGEIPPGVVVGGIPARVLRRVHEDHAISAPSPLAG